MRDARPTGLARTAGLLALILTTAGASPPASPSASTVPSAPTTAAAAAASPVPAPPDSPAPAVLAPPPRPVHASAHRLVTTRVPAAQAAYDRGLLMLYAFNIGASEGAFERAGRLDPSCAMAFFGQALTEITDINRSTDADGFARGRAAIRRAAAASEASADERALIAAAERRFTGTAADQSAAEHAYADAMRTFAEAHPRDADASVEAAFAIWHAEPTVQTDVGREIGPLLDRALAIEPENFGAHHLRIHFEEESGRPAVALPDADFLFAATYDPGESHLPHMAGHIYDRLGRYDEMIAANEIALESDARYFATGDAAGVAYMRGYHDHDVAFVLYGTTTLGENARAERTATDDDAAARTKVALRLHDWRGVLDHDGTTPADRAIALGRLGRTAAANAALAAIGSSAPAYDEPLARGAIALGRGDAAGAVAAYAKAYAALGDDLGDPKDRWAAPIGESYAAALLRAGRAAEAERIFTAELTRFPNDPRLLFGRAEARAEQHEDDRADREAARAAWRGSAPLTRADLG